MNFFSKNKGSERAIRYKIVTGLVFIVLAFLLLTLGYYKDYSLFVRYLFLLVIFFIGLIIVITKFVKNKVK
jgi:uncharacterized membrane protein